MKNLLLLAVMTWLIISPAPAQEPIRLSPINGVVCEASDHVRYIVTRSEDAFHIDDDAFAAVNEDAEDPVCVQGEYFGLPVGPAGSVIHDGSGQSWQVVEVRLHVRVEDGKYKPIDPPSVRWVAMFIPTSDPI
jgi:hypothetical protein